MGVVVGVLIGLLVGTFGFLVMRNPMRLALLSWQKGYYRRMVLDTTMRIQLRVLGVLVCLFGTSIFTASLGSAPRLNLLSVVSEGLWVLMGLIFFAAWGVGLILSARDAEDAKGSAFLHYRPTVPCTDFSGCRPIPSVGDHGRDKHCWLPPVQTRTGAY
jgi:hypothetical protein